MLDRITRKYVSVFVCLRKLNISPIKALHHIEVKKKYNFATPSNGDKDSEVFVKEFKKSLKEKRKRRKRWDPANISTSAHLSKWGQCDRQMDC